MKHLPFLLFGLMLFCILFGCKGNNSQETALAQQAEDSAMNTGNALTSYVGNWDSDNGNVLMSYIGNKDSVFRIVEDSIYRYMQYNKIELPANTIMQYNIVDSLLHMVYDLKAPQISTIEVEQDFAVSSHQIQFLNHYLLEKIDEIADHRLSKLLQEEKSLADRLITAQHEFLKAHIDNANADGSYSFIKYYNTSIAIHHGRNESLKDLYFSMTSNNYHVPMKYRDISDSLFDKEYAHILNDLIPQTFEDEPFPLYDETADRQALLKAKKAWYDFISKRNEIASVLQGKQKDIWNNATYRFLRSHLITLKNEFNDMGAFTSETAELLLPDSCTYEQLLAYPNFTTKWNEHLKEFE